MREVKCPYCNYKNDLTNIFADGVPEDNETDWECRKCGKEFEIQIEFEPCFSASKIIYENCDKCNKSTRYINKRGSTYPFPEKYKGNKLCKECFHDELRNEYKW